MEYFAAPVLIGTVQWILALLFALSSWSKLRDRAAFAGIVADYRLLPRALAAPLSLAIPFVEAVVAVGLLLDGMRATAAAWAGALIVLFSLAVFVNLLRGRTHIDCGCFGAAFRQRIGWSLLARNALLLAAVALVGYGGGPGRAVHWLDLLTMMAAAGAIVLLLGAWAAMRAPAAIAANRGEPAALKIVERQ